MSSDPKDARWQLAEDLAERYSLRYPTSNYASDTKLRDAAAIILFLGPDTLTKSLASRWRNEEQEEPMGKTPSTPPPAEVRWQTVLESQAQNLVHAHGHQASFLAEDKEIKDLAQDYQVREVKAILEQFDAEIIRLDEMKAQVISAKKQLKAAIFNG